MILNGSNKMQTSIHLLAAINTAICDAVVTGSVVYGCYRDSASASTASELVVQEHVLKISAGFGIPEPTIKELIQLTKKAVEDAANNTLVISLDIAANRKV